jgi:hypothetical protein
MYEHGQIIERTADPSTTVALAQHQMGKLQETLADYRGQITKSLKKIRGSWWRLWVGVTATAVQLPMVVSTLISGELLGMIVSGSLLTAGASATILTAIYGNKQRQSLRDLITIYDRSMTDPGLKLRIWQVVYDMKRWDEDFKALEAENWRELKLYGDYKVLNEKPSLRVMDIRGESYASMDKAFGGQAGPKTQAAFNELKASGGWSPQIDENSEAREIARKLISGLDELLTAAQVEEAMDVIEKLGDLDVVPDHEVLSALRRGGHRLRKLQKPEEEVVDLTDWQGDLDPRRLWAEDNERERRERLDENRRASGWTQIQIDLQAADEEARRAFETSGWADSIHPPRRRGDRRPPFDPSVPHYEDCAWCAHDPHQANHSHVGGL